ncbi:hypothetical protein JYU34_005848 [Plutella xylostella]|uniref:Reverse transcriptase domain-containing protein n=1 Tax=Plutella xylostella TaxID=51655 RepID=A0ABQ7QUA2_PLUXY|nr:hypothetical protein JYU34_005848 [Plutella xylostella]
MGHELIDMAKITQCTIHMSNDSFLSTLQEKRNNSLRIAHMNIRSIQKHFDEFNTYFNSSLEELDIIILTEINIKEEYQNILSLYKIQDFDLHAVCRTGRKGGGVALYARKELGFARRGAVFTSCESLAGYVKVRDTSVLVLALYRPPNNKVPIFLRELKYVLQSIPCSENLIILGDMNIDLLERDRHLVIEYENLMSEYSLYKMISVITREEIKDGKLTISCLDHIFVRTKLGEYHPNVVQCKISDHYLTNLNLTLPTELKHNNLKRTKTILDNHKIKIDIKKVQWSELLTLQCPLLIYESICKKFNDIYDNCKKEIKIRNEKRLTCPWLTKEISDMIIHKNRLFSIWKNDPSNMVNRLNFTRWRNRTHKLIFKTKNNYKKELIKKAGTNYKKIWEHVNKWLGKEKKSLDDVILTYMGKEQNVPDICNNFLHTFTEEIINIKSKHICKNYLLDKKDYLKDINVTMRYIKVSASQVERIIANLSDNKSPGIDNVRAIDLKSIKAEISPVIAKMINLFIEQSKYPQALKTSIIRPIYKNGDHKDTTNYRPIAILSCLNKIVEKAITGQISAFLLKHDVIARAQHGFQKGKSTSSLLMDFSNAINMALNNKQHVGVIFIDFKKAFDTLEHNILLRSMDSCGIRGNVNNWFKEYLNNRKVHVKIAEHVGECGDVRFGVATGSVTGPLCYIMHVNSMVNVVKKCQIFMFADDTCIMYADKDLGTIQSALQDDFNNITAWAHDNGILLNATKTNIMHIHSSYTRSDKNSLISIKGHSYDCLHDRLKNSITCSCAQLEQVPTCKYLGVIVDNRFNWNYHINKIVDYLRLTLCKFYQLKRWVSGSVLHCLYYALVDSIISYAVGTYGTTFKTYLNRITNLQTRFLKLLLDKNTRKQCNGQYDHLYRKFKIIPADKKANLEIIKEEYWSDKYKIKFTCKRSARRAGRLSVPRVNNVYGSRTKNYLVPKLFNQLPTDVSNVKPFNNHKKKKVLKHFFVQSL